MVFVQVLGTNYNIVKNEREKLLLQILLDLCNQLVINITKYNIDEHLHSDNVTKEESKNK